MYYRIYCVNLSGSIDWELDSINQSSWIKAHADCFSTKFSNSTQACLTCRVLCFAFSIKGKTLAMFYGCCCLCCVYESFVRSRGVCLHIYLGLSRLCQKLDDCFSCCIKSLKIHKQKCLYLLWIQERSSPWTRSCHVVVVVSFLLEVAIGC